MTPKDLGSKRKLKAILKAVKEKDDDYLWQELLKLSSAYLLEDWDQEPNHKTLLKLNIPLAIFHGENDGTVRVDGVLETERAFKKAKKANLYVKIYPKTDHDLNWPKSLRYGVIPNLMRMSLTLLTR